MAIRFLLFIPIRFLRSIIPQEYVIHGLNELFV